MNEKQKNYKPRLILLSDLWGIEKAEWIFYYANILAQHFDLKFYDSCDLANIDKSDYLEEKLHHQFINGGVTKAVENLLQQETENLNILGFSIGGYIGWKACLAGINAQHLFAISSTRLRFETEKPPINCTLFYGENDAYKPDKSWFDKLNIKQNCYPNHGHDLYKNQTIAESICKQIIEQIK